MSLLQKISRLSFTKASSIAIFAALLLGIPTTVYLAQQRTQIASQAFQKPSPATSPQTVFGISPKGPPQIGRIFPWVGKAGDIIFIQGKNFGTNPPAKTLLVGGVPVSEDQITAWNDDLIQAIIPQAAVQGGIVEIRVGDYPATKSLSFVIYNRLTPLKLQKLGNLIFVTGQTQIAKVKVWIGDENTSARLIERNITTNPEGRTTIFDTQNQPILTLLLYDSNGILLPYYVDPVQFDF